MTLKELFSKIETVNEFYDKVTGNKYPSYYIEFNIRNRTIIQEYKEEFPEGLEVVSFSVKTYDELEDYLNNNGFNNDFIHGVLSIQVELVEDQEILFSVIYPENKVTYKAYLYIDDYYDDGDHD